MVKLKIKHSVLSEKYIQKKNIREFIKEKFNLSEDQYCISAKDKVNRFIKTHDFKLKKECRFKQTAFLSKNKDWLERELCFDDEQKVEQQNAHDNNEVNLNETSVVDVRRLRSSVKDNEPYQQTRVNTSMFKSIPVKKIVRVRTVKPFEQCSRRTKKRRCEKIRSEVSESQLNALFLSYLKKNGRKLDAKILEKLRTASPDRKSKIIEILDNDSDIVPYTANEALALIVDTDLSYHQYEIIYPSYNRILQAKKECYPAKDSITISDTHVDISVQKILDHTAERLIKSLEDEIELDCSDVLIRYKWGLDGASSQSEYKQKFDNVDSTDKSVLMTSLVPLQVEVLAKSEPEVLWRNPKSSSTRYCRPIAFKFANETKKQVVNQVDFIEKQIEKLRSTQVMVKDKPVKISHHLRLTMLDGKTMDYLTDTSFCNCNICQAKPSQMNDFQCIAKLTVNTNNYSFGLSTLHCWIRFLECLLHIAYRIPIVYSDLFLFDINPQRSTHSQFQKSRKSLVSGRRNFNGERK